MSDDPTPLSSADAQVAHEFLGELRTRIATRELPYRDGIEVTALESLRDLFKFGREAVRRHPGGREAADRVAHVLNDIVAPVTAKWHRLSVAGRLASRDGADEFRRDLAGVQKLLRVEAAEFYRLAFGRAPSWSAEDWAQPRRLDPGLTTPMAFGIDGSLAVHRDPVSAADFERINRTESEAVAARRLRHGVRAAPGMNAVGLAFSGGGIRSAVFCLGVAQVLSARGYFPRVDFLSTVSGGGYAGSFLTRRLGEVPEAGEKPGVDRVDAPHGPDTEAVRFLRLHAKYINSDDPRARWWMLCQTVGGTLLNAAAPFLVVVMAALAATWLGWGTPEFARWRSLAVSVMGGVTGLALVTYGIGLRHRWGGTSTLGATLAVSAAATLGLAATAGLDHWFLRSGSGAESRWVSFLSRLWNSGGLAAIAATGLPALMRAMPVIRSAKVRKAVVGGALVLAGLAVPVAAVLVFYALLPLGSGWLLAVGAGLAVVAGFALDINRTGPRRLYQECLARTFIRRREGAADDIPLSTINPEATAPYHLLNATLNIPASRAPSLKERGCDFFLFSRGWMGSPAVGYRAASEWKEAGAEVGLGMAMATSGAAASAHMGLMPFRSVTALLALLNVRLGLWLRRPGVGGRSLAPGPLCLLREMTGFGMSETAAWLNLTDGGHIENTGVYELLRRRCKFVLCVDAEADPEFRFPGLMTLVRHARIDLGVDLQPDLEELRPDPATGLCRSHHQLCPIVYSDGAKGLMLYLKLSMTGNEPELLRGYRRAHPEFPHQSTADQFFDQEQFEVYRSLGVHVAESLFQPALLGLAGGESSIDEAAPLSEDRWEDWYLRLANSLLATSEPSDRFVPS